MTTTEFPQPVPGKQEPALAPPEGHREEWAEKADKAQKARELGRKLRKGKRVQFSSRHHLAS